MVNSPNIIYKIRYDFDLNEGEITIPDGCILEFRGGSLKNGSIKGINTIINVIGKYRIFYDIKFKGTFTNTIIYPEYFGAIGDDKTDCTDSINKAADLCRLLDGEIKFLNGIYKVTDTINLSAINVDGSGAIIKGYIENQKAIIDIDPRFGHTWASFDKRTRFIRNIRVNCNSQDNIGIKVYGDGQIFDNIHIREVGWLGFYSYKNGNATLNNFLIEGSNKSFDFSVGLALETPDWQVSNGVIQNVAIGVISSTNFFNNIHTWGYNTRHSMYIHLLVLNGNICYVSNWYFDTVSTSSPDNSEHPSWILKDDTDIKRKIYVGNAAILCLDKAKVYLNTCRTFQASGQSIDGVTPIFLYNDSGTTNKIVNTVILDNFIKYKSGNTNAKYIVNDNDYNVIVLEEASLDTLIKLYDFDQVYNHKSIIFNIETSCNGVPIIAKVASYYASDTGNIQINALIDNISDINDYINKYNVSFYKTEKSLYYRLTTKYSYYKTYIIKYSNDLKNITPIISTDNIDNAKKIQPYYNSYVYEKNLLNTGIFTLKDVGNKSIIRLCETSFIPIGSSEYYDIVFSLNTKYIRLGISIYNNDGQFSCTIFPYCTTVSITSIISGCIYNGYVYISISSPYTYVKNFYIQNYTKYTKTTPIIDNSINVEEGTPAIVYDYTYNNGLTDKKTNGLTNERPTGLNANNIGFEYFDTTLSKPIWWSGTQWIDSTGISV